MWTGKDEIKNKKLKIKKLRGLIQALDIFMFMCSGSRYIMFMYPGSRYIHVHCSCIQALDIFMFMYPGSRYIHVHVFRL